VEGILTRMIVGIAKCFDLYGAAAMNHKRYRNKKASTDRGFASLVWLTDPDKIENWIARFFIS